MTAYLLVFDIVISEKSKMAAAKAEVDNSQLVD